MPMPATHEPSIALAKMLIDRAPGGMRRVYFGLSGSDANETHVKLVWYYNNVLGRPDKKKIISRWRGYHGASVMAGSLTGLADLPQRVRPAAARRSCTPSRPITCAAPTAARARRILELTAPRAGGDDPREGPDTVAAFIGEPMLGTGGIIPPPEGYWAGDPGGAAQVRRAADRR